jgi:hypothetical protein
VTFRIIIIRSQTFRLEQSQCECGRPVPHRPHDFGFPLQEGASDPPLAGAEANTESFFKSFLEPQWGQGVPFQLLDRTSTSASRLQSLQWNS